MKKRKKKINPYLKVNRPAKFSTEENSFLGVYKITPKVCDVLGCPGGFVRLRTSIPNIPCETQMCFSEDHITLKKSQNDNTCSI